MYRLFLLLFSFNSLFSLIIAIITISLIISHRNLLKKDKDISKWRKFCYIPIILCIIHFIIFNFHRLIPVDIQLFGLIYMSAIFTIILQFCYRKKKLYILISTLCVITSILGFLVIFFMSISVENLHNFSYQSYTKSFENTLKTLEKEYPLTEHKGIDYNSLYNKYYADIEKAEKNKDERLYLKTMSEFSHEFKDGHFTYLVNAETQEKVFRPEFTVDYENRDYGFCSILLDNNDVVAIMIDKESLAYQNGLRNGYKITKKNGEKVENLIEDITIPTIRNYPVKRDELLYKSLYLFSTGADEISVSFIGDNGEEKTISVKTYDNDKIKYRASDMFEKLTYADSEQETYITKMLDSKTGYIYIANESYSFIKGALAYIPGKSSYLYDLIDSKISSLKEQGMEKLVIDLRGNSGGYATESAEIASFFTDDSYYFERTVKYKTNLADKTKLYGNGKYKDIPVTVLVNSHTISAGDGLVYLLSKCDNVKIVGITNSNNSFQSIGGFIVLSDGNSYINYPTYNSLDMEGNILIDTDYTGEATLKVDYKIPLDKDSIIDIAYNDDDYALDYITNNNVFE